MAKDRLITPSYCFILAANFLLYFGFWLLIPVLPFYLSEFFQAGTSTIGIVLSCYTVAALCIRPFSGYLLDTFARKPLYLFAYFIFMMMFGGYLIAGSLTLFIIFRIIHGVSFGMVTVGGNTTRRCPSDRCSDYSCMTRESLLLRYSAMRSVHVYWDLFPPV